MCPFLYQKNKQNKYEHLPLSYNFYLSVYKYRDFEDVRRTIAVSTVICPMRSK